MHTGQSYRLFEFLDWTRRDIYVLVVLGEARQIWGDILSGSRAWGIMSRDYLDDTDSQKSSPIVTSPG